MATSQNSDAPDILQISDAPGSASRAETPPIIVRLEEFKKRLPYKNMRSLTAVAIEFKVEKASAVTKVFSELADEARESMDAEDRELVEDLERSIKCRRQSKKLHKYFKGQRMSLSQNQAQPNTRSVSPHPDQRTNKRIKMSLQELRNGDPSCDVQEHCVLQGVDITQKLMDARKLLLRDMAFSDILDLLPLNFIFTEEYLRKNFNDDIVDDLLFANLPVICGDDEDAKRVGTCGHMASLPREQFREWFHEFDKSWAHPVRRIIDAVSAKETFWGASDPYPNESSYQARFVNPVITGFLSSHQHREEFNNTSLPMPSNHHEEFQPDFFGAIGTLPFMIAEIKKPTEKGRCLDVDRLKLYCMMKLALDSLVMDGVEESEVIGLLVQYDRCQVYVMNMIHEAMYIPRPLGTFSIPKYKGDIGSLSGALPILSAME
ncbi:hypothetical protein BGX34_003642, partial [Mortierella sp. NVP85]